MNSYEGMTEARERVGARRAAIACGLVTNCNTDKLDPSVYVVLYDTESEQRFVDILHGSRDLYRNVRYESQIKLPYGVSDSTVWDTVNRAKEIFENRGMVFVLDSISEAELAEAEGCKRQVLGGNLFRVSKNQQDAVDYYLESAIINRDYVEPQTHFQTPVDVLR